MPPRVAPACHAGPDGMRYGDIGRQHRDDAQAPWGRGAPEHHPRWNAVPLLEHGGRHTEALKIPCVGDKWGCDEKRQDMRGRESHVVAVMDLATRLVPAWDVSCTKEYDAIPLLRSARDAAGRIPRAFITDGLERRHIAFERVFHTMRDQAHPHTEPHLQRQQTGKAQRRAGGPLYGMPAA